MSNLEENTEINEDELNGEEEYNCENELKTKMGNNSEYVAGNRDDVGNYEGENEEDNMIDNEDDVNNELENIVDNDNELVNNISDKEVAEEENLSNGEIKKSTKKSSHKKPTKKTPAKKTPTKKTMNNSKSNSEDDSEETAKKSKKTQNLSLDNSQKSGKKDDARAIYRQNRDTVYTFFYYLNKPVSSSELALQFKTMKKKELETILDDLIARDKIFLKLFGAKKFYCLSQNHEYAEDSSYTDEIDDQQDKKITDRLMRFYIWKSRETSEKLKQLKEESREIDAQIAAFDNEMSMDELKREVERLEKFIASNGHLKDIEVVDGAEFEAMKKKISVLQKENIKRRRIFKEIISAICEGSDYKESTLLEEAGIDL